MLRGFRWQLIVFIMALALFSLSLISRSGEETPPSVIDPTAELSTTITPLAETAILATPLPTSDAVDNASNVSGITTYREALVGSIQRLNPLLANLSPVDRDITSLIFEGLTRINQYGEPVADLAKSWVISSDGLEYVVHLRDDVLWQDGVAFSADDVIYTFSLLQSADFPGDQALGKFWQTIEIQKLDPYLIRFRLTQPLGEFLDALQVPILPEHALVGTTAKQIGSHPFSLSPIGTGPYQLEALRSTDGVHIQSVDLRVSPVYRQRPEGHDGYTMERMSFYLFDTFDAALNALKNGQVDGLAGKDASERDALLNLPGVSLHTSLQSTVGVLIFNWAKDTTKFFREQRVRIALQRGLNRSAIIERSLSDTAILADSPLIPGSWAYTGDLPWPSPDLDAAKQLLDTVNLQKIGGRTSDTGPLFSFSILTPNRPNLVSLVQDIAAQWSQLNIQVNVDVVDESTYQDRLNSHDFDAALVELSMGGSADPDVYAFWDGDKNYGGMDDRRIAEELERARRDPSGINRSIRYQNFQREFVERAVAIPLYYPLYTYAVASNIDGVQLGFMSSPANRFYTLHDWKINQPG